MTTGSVVFLLLLCFGLVLVSNADTGCRFAPEYTLADILSSESVQLQFIGDVMEWEGHFHDIAYNHVTGMTYDGHGLNWKTGALAQPLHYWSAPSKESLHLMLMNLALNPSTQNTTGRLARRFINSARPDLAGDTVLEILSLKISTLIDWNQRYPGYGGFLPWFYNFDTGLVPADGWNSSVPALDNGEMIWGLFGMQVVLEALLELPASQRGVNASVWTDKAVTELRDSVASYLKYVSESAMVVFYAGNGLVRSVTDIYDIYSAPLPSNYWMSCQVGCYLDDPYEGEMMTVFLYLYSHWNNATERNMLWVQKRAMLQSVDFVSPIDDGEVITVQRGFWFSSHEQWKYLALPYLTASPINRRVFLNGERARTRNSNAVGIAGLHASVTDVVSQPGELPPDYISATGIQQIAFELITDNNVVTPYAAFPVMLADLATGLAWYLQMIQAPRMQNPFGSTESINISASAFSPVLTWDSKTPSLVAMLGGTASIVEVGLRRDGTYDDFAAIIDREWERVFPTLQGEDLPFAAPAHTFPDSTLSPDFLLCQRA